MKILNCALVTLLFPLLANASNLIYPEDAAAHQFSPPSTSLSDVAKTFKLDINPADFRLVDKKESLLGTHYYYQQTLGGYEVEDAILTISVDKNGNIIKIHDATTSTPDEKMAMVPFITKEVAIELAWKKLKVNGDLLQAPTVKLTLSEKAQLVYKVTLGTSSPYGYWHVAVDAYNGKIVSVTDASITRMKKKGEKLNSIYRSSKTRLTPLNEALKNFEAKNASDKMNSLVPAVYVTGSALVFDPNPTITLGRTDLLDTMDDSIFLPAYKKQALNEISLENGVYTLKGSKVTIIDFDPPTDLPSTSTDGNWTAHRGNNAFNDVMTYVHIDRSIRYIESLGFTGTKVIFPKSLEVDSDGVKGEDNSYYIPTSRRIAYGHGCVDDNEDSDVILHELGHAIQHHINQYWSGGDTGAMGESFGDYWAASYSVTLPGGMDTEPNWVYKWDGHNACWDGRKLNAFLPKYNPAKTYPAHANVNGGNSDEVFSTPIFQAFLELYGRGVPRGNMDKILLEAQFGLGSKVKIPQFAKAIVKTAKALFPNEDYDQVYLKHFQIQGIL